jgi:aspartokinase-like uncharacterized kinase
MSSYPVRVVKVGGSLLDMPEFPETLRDWLSAQAIAAHVLVVGGGSLADGVRALSRRFRMDQAAAHWACVDLLTATARIVASLVPSLTFIRRFDELQSALQNVSAPCVVFAVADFLERVEPLMPAPALPRDWSATTDSIAARLAVALNAAELVLLKSTHCPPEVNCRTAADRGLVDEFFPIASECLAKVRWVNLRDASAGEQHLPK